MADAINPRSNFQAHTVVCVDLAAPGYPVTTISAKIIDAHVTDLEQAFVYFPIKDFTPNGETLYPLPTEFVVYGHDATLDELTGRIIIVGGYGMNGSVDPGEGTGSLIDPDTDQFGVSPGNVPVAFAPTLGAVESFQSSIGDNRILLQDGSPVQGTYGDALPLVHDSDAPGTTYKVGGALIAGTKRGSETFIQDATTDTTRNVIDYRASNTDTSGSNYFQNGMVQRVQDDALFGFGYGPEWYAKQLAARRDPISTLEATDVDSIGGDLTSLQTYYFPGVYVETGTTPPASELINSINPTSFMEGLRGGYAFYAGGKVYTLGRINSRNSMQNENRPAGQQCLNISIQTSTYHVPGSHGDGICPVTGPDFERTRTTTLTTKMHGEIGIVDYNTDSSVFFKYVMDPHYATVPLTQHLDSSVDYFTATNPPFLQCYLTTTTNYECANLGFGFGAPYNGQDFGPFGVVRHYQSPYFFRMDWESGRIEGMDFVDTDWIVKDRDPFDTAQADHFVGPDTDHEWSIPREAKLGKDGEGNIYLIGGFRSSSKCYSIYMAKSQTVNSIYTERKVLEAISLFHSQRRFLYSGDFFQNGTFAAVNTGFSGSDTNIIYSGAPYAVGSVLKFDYSSAVAEPGGLEDLPVVDPQTASPSRITSVGSISSGRFGHTVTHIGGSEFLVIGGWDSIPGNLIELCSTSPTGRVEILNAKTGTSRLVGNLMVGRGYHHCLDIGQGRFFISGGDSPPPDRYPTSNFSGMADVCSPYTPTWEVITLDPFTRVASGALDYNPLKQDGSYINTPPTAFSDVGLNVNKEFGGTPAHGDMRYTIRGHVAVADAARKKIHIVGGYHGLTIAFSDATPGVTGVDSRYPDRVMTKLVDVPYPVVLGDGQVYGSSGAIQIPTPYGSPDPALSNPLLLPWYPANYGTTYFFDDLDSGDLDARTTVTRAIEPMFLWDHGPFGESNGIRGLHDRGLYRFDNLMSQVVLSINADW